MNYKSSDILVVFNQHLYYEPVHTDRPGELIAYYKIARHYNWALDQLFYKHNFSRVIILEDDMEIALDFFDYFEAGAKLLDRYKSIMAISSWNDNGQRQFVHDPYVLYRSDFFPGLGWMLSRSTWDELGRQFIRPEVCRTYNFGEHGSSMGQFFKQYLEPIRLNDVQVCNKSQAFYQFGTLMRPARHPAESGAGLGKHSRQPILRTIPRLSSVLPGSQGRPVSI
ncbi:Alpha-1-3-mannosyl-glycoprotein 2-beta-N-acetylglucosaminyltransferase [Striga hermonthica]|uniref:Alpha-1,3-mannosyl-glycoprotein 2-beta-N-acetylglucosaminyltransferase n=1 Tax=Striga hermonthica TaxID=68872 RepID=A0A9N7RQ92_STRHE|nr:Alpha-1-3-mannosyl-glycoprotein 2-beta-N-acetylglucosaminyltransferase [Striga hermonthica]